MRRRATSDRERDSGDHGWGARERVTLTPSGMRSTSARPGRGATRDKKGNLSGAPIHPVAASGFAVCCRRAGWPWQTGMRGSGVMRGRFGAAETPRTVAISVPQRRGRREAAVRWSHAPTLPRCHALGLRLRRIGLQHGCTGPWPSGLQPGMAASARWFGHAASDGIAVRIKPHRRAPPSWRERLRRRPSRRRRRRGSAPSRPDPARSAARRRGPARWPRPDRAHRS